MLAWHIFFPAKLNGLRKKITIATWSEPQEANIHAGLDYNLTAFNEYKAQAKEKYGLTITPTHLAIKAMGESLAAGPGLNGKIVFGKYIPYD